MDTKTAKALREERNQLVAEMRTHHDENQGDWKAENQEKHDRYSDDISKLTQRIKNVEQLEGFEGSLKKPAGDGTPLRPNPNANPGDRPNDNQNPTISIRTGTGRKGPLYTAVPIGKRGSKEYREDFARYLKVGRHGEGFDRLANLQSDDDPQAGYLLASEQLTVDLLKDVDDLLFIRQHARIHTVREATSLGIRKRTARLNTFDWSAELQVQANDTALAFGKKMLTPHHLTGSVRASRDLLRRSTMSVEQIVREEMARDAGEAMEDGYLIGDGNQCPLGVFIASSDGISTTRDVSSGNTTTAIGADNLREVKYSLKSQYRNMGPRWLFHRDAIKQISLLKDGESQYLWRPGITIGDPDTLLAYPVDESERVPNTFTTGLYVGLLAVWRFYEIADALDMEMQRLEELQARTNEIEFIGRLKTDGLPTLEEAFARVTLA